MTFLIQQTLLYAIPLMIVALAGVFAERSGIINLALEGIMIFGAFIGVLFVNIVQQTDVFVAAKEADNWIALQGLEMLAMLAAAVMGAVFSLLLSFASINLRADQTIGGTALNLMAPALVLFLVRIIANQNTLRMATGDAASWFMIKKTTLGYERTADLGFLGNTFIDKVYIATYICIIVFIILSCACAPAAKTHRRRIRWASTSTRCATSAPPSPARWPVWAGSSTRSPRPTARRTATWPASASSPWR